MEEKDNFNLSIPVSLKAEFDRIVVDLFGGRAKWVAFASAMLAFIGNNIPDTPRFLG